MLIKNSGVEQRSCKGETMVDANNGGKNKIENKINQNMIQLVFILLGKNVIFFSL